MAEDLEVNKAVQGENQKNYIENKEINEKNKEINTGNVKPIDIGIKPVNMDKEKIQVDISPKEDIKTEINFDEKGDIFTQKERESRVFFSLGGHDTLTNYNYGLIDNSRIEKYGIDYNLFIKRDSYEENRENSKLNSDYIKTSFVKDKINLALELKNGQQEFPGMGTSSTQVKSDKEFVDFGTELNYDLAEDTKLNFKYSFGKNSSESLTGTAYTRNFKQSAYEISGVKEFLYKDKYGNHSIDAKLGIVADKNRDEKNNILFAEGKDRFTLEKITDTEFKAMVKLEGGNETNLSINLLASRKLDEDIKINAGLYMNADYTLTKDIIKDSPVDDLVAFGNLKNEKIYGIQGGMTYFKDKLYVNLDASINSAHDLITYEAVEVDTGKEKAIIPKNYDKGLSYLDIKTKVSYTKNEILRSEGNFYFSSLTSLAYRPSFKASVEGIYKKDKYEGRLKYNLNGTMYSKNKNDSGIDREQIGAFGTVDFLNTYSVSKDYILNLSLKNLLDSKGEKMKAYPINGRVISLGVEIKY